MNWFKKVSLDVARKIQSIIPCINIVCQTLVLAIIAHLLIKFKFM
jgi:hypothetical protein